MNSARMKSSRTAAAGARGRATFLPASAAVAGRGRTQRRRQRGSVFKTRLSSTQRPRAEEAPEFGERGLGAEALGRAPEASASGAGPVMQRGARRRRGAGGAPSPQSSAARRPRVSCLPLRSRSPQTPTADTGRASAAAMDEKGESVHLRAVGDPPESCSPIPAKDDPEDDYDPHLHRQLSRPTNNLETLVHLLKCSLGTGILAMPQAFARAGLLTGAAATLLVGALVTHCLHVLVRAQYAACVRARAPLLAYPAAAAAALRGGPAPLRRLARPAALAVDVFLVVYQLGICCVYIVFIADNIKKVVDPYYEMAVEIHMLIILGPLIAFNLIPSLKMLAPFSALANVMTFVGLGIIVYYLLAGKKPEARGEPLDLWGSAESFPLFFGTVLFALTAVGVVIALENNMKTPKAFGAPCGVLNCGMAIIVLLYVAVGAIGYVFCVSKCSDSITLDLPRDDPLATSVVVMFAVAIFISYGLHCYVPVEVLWTRYVLPRVAGAAPARVRAAEYALRVGLCLLTFVLAVAVPRLGLFISLFGALCLSALGICFPALMEICVNFPKRPSAARSILFAKDVLLFLVGIVGLVAGTYTALVSIVRSFQPAPAEVPQP